MTGFCKFFCSTIGRKLLMSLTGLAMSLFLLAHVLGNLVILLSYEKYNAYSHSLVSNPMLLYPAEAGLIAVLLIHIYTAIRLTMHNRASRPVPYAVLKNTGRSRRSPASYRMMISGFFLLAFIIYHLAHFKFGAHYETVQDGVTVRDLSRLVVEEFKKIEVVFIYTIAMLLLFAHLIHGFRSAFETLGLATTNKWDRAFALFSKVFVYAVIAGFILIPVWIYFFHSPFMEVVGR